MATEASQTSRPGVSVGPTSEFSLFFQVMPGHGDDLRESLQTLQHHPGYRPGEYHMAIATIHEARVVLFDDDTRLLFATPHVWPHLPLTESREALIREAFERVRAAAGLELRLGWELTPRRLVMPVVQLAGFNPHRQAILLRRERAGRIRGKRAGRVLGLVEVQHHLAVLREIGVEKSPGRIGLFPAGEIVKDEEEMKKRRRGRYKKWVRKKESRIRGLRVTLHSIIEFEICK